ncbi:hypothetical protein [Nocardia donostiensis]|uniref:hypothetical protein n=1 Tax=Nocardia donostiensis TaxID=1538463 RepID=UPI001C37D31E|nr:hypothetical protein [Nocardia donostiensis]
MSATVPGAQVPAATMTVALLCFAPVRFASAGDGLFSVSVLLPGTGTAVLASVVSPLLEWFAIRRLISSTYGALMAVCPAIAGLSGVLPLGETLSLVQWAAIGTIAAVSVAATRVRTDPQVSRPHIGADHSDPVHDVHSIGAGMHVSFIGARSRRT